MDVGSLSQSQLEAIGEQIADLSLRIDLAKHALLTALRQFDAHEAWANSGFTSTAAWLAWRIQIGITAAREHVRVARRLGELPAVDAAFATGELSYAKVRAITRAATPEIEREFIELAMRTTAAQLEKATAAYRRVRVDPAELDMSTTDTRRFVRRSETHSGMVRLEIQLPPEEANMVWEAMASALETSRRAALAEERGRARAEPPGPGEHQPNDSAESPWGWLPPTTSPSGESLGVPNLSADPASERGRALRLRDGGCRVPGSPW